MTSGVTIYLLLMWLLEFLKIRIKKEKLQDTNK